jgi:hypothetical protein
VDVSFAPNWLILPKGNQSTQTFPKAASSNANATNGKRFHEKWFWFTFSL